ncbi:C40 family peptidase [Xylanimonas sp. McL0601]|uniref:C40 family peptidase n=1 Tax=Xylanimonas sp. McL0601 TaxID=3414739 RepID=UPI003CF4A3E4
MNSRHTARHRAERTPLSTLTGAIRAVAADGPKGAGRSAVVVATAGGIVMSAIAPAGAETLGADAATEPRAAETRVEATALEATRVSVEQIADHAREALGAAPTVQVSAEAVIEVERTADDGAAVAVVRVTPAPPPPPPPASPTLDPAAASPSTAGMEAPAEAPAPATEAPAPTGDWSAAASIALRYVGTRYVFGGSSPAGFDCSGLVVYAYRQLGVNLPHQSTAMRDSSHTRRISRAEARPGDIIWSPGHVSIYLGNGRQVEATRPGGYIVRTSNIWQSNPVFLRVV